MQAKAAGLSHLIGENGEQQAPSDEVNKEFLENNVASLVVSALDIANLVGFDLEAAVKKQIIGDISNNPIDEAKRP